MQAVKLVKTVAKYSASVRTAARRASRRRQLALQHHPDKNKSPDAEEKFKEIRQAYEILTTAKHGITDSPTGYFHDSDSGYSGLSRQGDVYASHADWHSSGSFISLRLQLFDSVRQLQLSAALKSSCLL
ncbi:hypothetical protein HPB50_007433 [Hyalomma asiaticum]|uniref:Uncharacterized protein n=1 Tax=Hyalomma asiaticum TaxID=266040 RepID=A0ACB7TGB6_HYAAI|nr:hypothetical protein HPB50_007433 [Hyalomma asiaticum]